tara:strand:+ start:341 stop:1156 length:816 start_codon:yes stop_codon:yes gene_type:complete
MRLGFFHYTKNDIDLISEIARMNIFRKMETFIYKHIMVPLQGRHIFDFASETYSRGKKVIDFGSGVGTNSKLFYPDDYIGVEIDASRVEESRHTFPNHQFQVISYVSSGEQRLPFQNRSFDIVFISLCLHHIDSHTCKILFREFRRLLKKNGIIVGIEPVVTSSGILSNLFMNLIDVGDYIISQSNYTAMYASESFKVDPIKVINIFGYRLWQYTAIPQGEKTSSFSSDMTAYRKIIKPIHFIIVLYGKWVLAVLLGYFLFQFAWIKIFLV